MSTIVEVNFREHVTKPHNMQGTNCLRTKSEVGIGESVLVDKLSESTNGIIAEKTIVTADGVKIMHRSMYPWGIISGVRYEKISGTPVSEPRPIDGVSPPTPQKR